MPASPSSVAFFLQARTNGRTCTRCHSYTPLDLPDNGMHKACTSRACAAPILCKETVVNPRLPCHHDPTARCRTAGQRTHMRRFVVVQRGCLRVLTRLSSSLHRFGPSCALSQNRCCYLCLRALPSSRVPWRGSLLQQPLRSPTPRVSLHPWTKITLICLVLHPKVEN